MPNWCDNYAKISHADPAKLQELVLACNSLRLLATYIPEPASLPLGEVVELADGTPIRTVSKSQWDWRVENWGTKWEINNFIGDLAVKDGKVCLRFDSAWAPPIPLWRVLADLGFVVEAYYFEPGVGFCGRFTDGVDQCFDDNIRLNAPRDIAVTFNFEDFYGEDNTEGRGE